MPDDTLAKLITSRYEAIGYQVIALLMKRPTSERCFGFLPVGDGLWGSPGQEEVHPHLNKLVPELELATRGNLGITWSRKAYHPSWNCFLPIAGGLVADHPRV